MNIDNKTVAWILRADGIFNGLSGIFLLFYIRPVLDLIGWSEIDAPIYANVLGAALVGLSLAVILAANHPERSEDIILSSIVAKGLAGACFVYYFIVGLQTSSLLFQYVAVAVQVLFVVGEALYLLSLRRRPARDTAVARANANSR